MTVVSFGPAALGVTVPPASPAPPLVVSPLDDPPDDDAVVEPELEPPDEEEELDLSSPPHAAIDAAKAMPNKNSREFMRLS